MPGEHADEVVRSAERGYAAQINDAAERVKIQATIADRALQSMVVVHGGAMIALFTFIGAVATKAGQITVDWSTIKCSFGCFAFGLTAILIAHLFAFAAQDRFYMAAMYEAYRHEKTIASRELDSDQSKVIAAHKTGYAYFGTGIALFVISAGLFIGGCIEALTAFKPA